jgi:hypothetical protein
MSQSYHICNICSRKKMPVAENGKWKTDENRRADLHFLFPFSLIFHFPFSIFRFLPPVACVLTGCLRSQVLTGVTAPYRREKGQDSGFISLVINRINRLSASSTGYKPTTSAHKPFCVSPHVVRAPVDIDRCPYYRAGFCNGASAMPNRGRYCRVVHEMGQPLRARGSE